MLTDARNPDTTRYDLGIHLLSTIFIQLGLVIIDLAGIDLTKERHHFGV
jgi:hypothetical protein